MRVAAKHAVIYAGRGRRPIAFLHIFVSSRLTRLGKSFTDQSAANPFLSSTSPSICSTCARPPPFGHSLLRCSRCKCAYYCSRTCQKQAWKLHKTECDPVSAPSPSTVLDTPDVSIPSSPAHVTEAPQFNLTAEIIRDAPSQCDAIHDAVYTASPAEQRDTF